MTDIVRFNLSIAKKANATLSVLKRAPFSLAIKKNAAFTSFIAVKAPFSLSIKPLHKAGVEL